MKSMTGYARIEKTIDVASITFEIKSYNSRYLDIYINLPFWMSSLENYIREYFLHRIYRGKVEITVRIKTLGNDFTVNANTNLAKMYANAIRQISQEIEVSQTLPLEYILNQEGVLTADKNFDEEKWQNIFTPLMDEAFLFYDNTRISEGQALQNDIDNMIVKIINSNTTIKSHSTKIEEMFKTNVQQKFQELLKDAYDQTRVFQEIAALLMKYTINEEIIRLESHLNTLKKEVKNNGAIGKRIDFICQEINREINTIGSKNQLYEIAQEVIIAKEALENIREQIRNVE